VKGVFNLTRFLQPLLEKAASDDDPARVINIGSIDGLRRPHSRRTPTRRAKPPCTT
jgi:hypothetical protein